MAGYKILDGAIGSELIRRGVDLPKHIWSAEANVTNPDTVKRIHEEYVAAGADYITTNTFRTTPRAYLKTGVDYEESAKMAKNSLLCGVKLARDAAGSSVKVVGAIAPLEDCYMPQLFTNQELAVEEFCQTAKWLSKAKVDILLLETMNSLAETEAGLIALQNFKHPIWVSFILKNDRHLLSGDPIDDVFEMMKLYSVDCIMFNCNPLDRTAMAVEKLVDRFSSKWGVYPNLGVGEPSPDGNITNYESMEKFISLIDRVLHLGASVVGACCGSSPEHIAAINKMRHDSE